MQPSVTSSGEVECLYLNRLNPTENEPEIPLLLEALDEVLQGNQDLADEYSTWLARNEARVAADMEPNPVPDHLCHYDTVKRLRGRAHDIFYKGGRDNYDTVAVTAAEARSIDELALDDLQGSARSAVFLMKIAGFFKPKTAS